MFKKITQKVANNRKKDPIVINKQQRKQEDINSEKENPAVIETKVINRAAVIETNKKINKAVIEKNKKNGLIDNLLDDVTLTCCAAAPISNSTMSGSDDEDAKSADLDAELDALDIDNDFTLSFGEGDDDDDASDDDNDKSSDDDAVLVDSVVTTPPKTKVPTVADPAYAALQLSRDEVFSRHYHANPAEEEALKDVSIQLGVTTKHTLSLSSTVLTLLSTTTTTNVNKADDPDYRGNSILLKRGIVSIGQEEKELLLFTHGFIVARKVPTAAASIGLRASVMGMVMPSAPKFDSCHYYQHVNWVKDLWQLTNDSDNDPKYCYSIQISDAASKTKELQFGAASLRDKQSWLAAWERVLLQNRSRRDASDRIVGWQHTLLQTSLYTAAVTGQAFFGPHHLQQANVLDEYNGLAPLHYAAIHNQVHVIEELLSMETGDDDDANVELEDAEGRTPMYYAERDNMAPAIEALQKGGAVASAAFEREQHGALVEEARELEAAATTKQEQETSELMQGAATPDTGRRRSWLTQAFAGLDNEKYSQEEAPAVAKARQAQSAQSHMKDALAGIHDRGDKINDLGDKTAELEDNAAEFQDLAAQLRQKMEKQNKGLNFLNPFAR